jgi:hypothetical protein
LKEKNQRSREEEKDEEAGPRMTDRRVIRESWEWHMLWVGYGNRSEARYAAPLTKYFDPKA